MKKIFICTVILSWIYLAICQIGFDNKITRRDLNLESIENILRHDIQFLNEKPGLCVYSTKTNFLNCFGVNETFGCEVISRLNDLKNVSVELTNLKIVENNFTLNLFERESNFTFLTPENKRQVIVSIKNTDDFREPGILVENENCWSNLFFFIENLSEVNFKLSLFL